MYRLELVTQSRMWDSNPGGSFTQKAQTQNVKDERERKRERQNRQEK